MDAHVRSLRAFVTVAQEQNVTRAAQLLFVSQPALSKQMRQLEDRLGATLLVREPRGIRLTAAGEALLPRAQRILAEWDATLPEVRAAAAASEQTVSVGFHTWIGRGVVAAVTAAMRAELPGWRMQFRQVPWDDPAVGLAGGGTDVGIAWLPVPPDAGLATKVVSAEACWVAMRHDHALADRVRIPFAALADEAFVALPVSAGPMRDFWLGAGHRRAPARVAQEASTAEEAFEAVAAGTGLVLLAEGNAGQLRRDDIVTRPVDGLPLAELAVLWRADDRRPAVQLVVRSACACAGAATPDP